MSHEISTQVENPVPEVLCLARTEIDLPVFIGNAEALTGHVPSKLCDVSTIDLQDPARYLICLAEMFERGRGRSAVELLRQLPTFALQYLHYTFLIVCDPHTGSDFRVANRCQTNVTDGFAENMVVVLGTGPLLQWKESILANSNKQASLALSNERSAYYTRLIFNKIQIHFERKEGLHQLFDMYRKVRLEDQSFILEEI